MEDAARDQREIAPDVLRIFENTGRAELLRLLERPAAAFVKPQLQSIARSGCGASSSYALYALGYALEPGDIPFLTDFARSAQPQLSASAGLYLLQLGSRDGWDGIRSGPSDDEDLRIATYTGLYPHLPAELREEARFDPQAPAGTQDRALNRIDTFLRQR